MTIPLERKTNHPPKTSRGEQKPFIDLNDHLEYSTNTNATIGRIGTMLTHLSNFKQLDQGVSKKPV
jgi:hypothetical protein